MKLKKIVYKNHNILGNLEIDFTDNQGRAKDLIFLAGENGCGKTTIINDIFAVFSNNNLNFYEIDLELNDGDVEFLEKENDAKFKDFSKRELTIINPENQKYYNINIDNIDNIPSKIFGNPIKYLKLYERCKCLYSVAEINFPSNRIQNVTSMDIDDLESSEKQTKDISEKITQLLIDIKNSDDTDLADWVNENPGKIPPDEIKEKRLRRFKTAFNYMFENDLIFDSIRNENGYKKVYFKRKDKLISIDDLSSGEKQIVYRGGFILRDIGKLENSIILIDEPELSLHPLWQQKIVEYFRRMCIDEEGKQICQMIICTHSPFILHAKDRKDDKVIILKRDLNGNIYELEHKEFYKCSSIETIEEAFSLKDYISEIKSYENEESALIITEGKTDWKHLKKAIEKLTIHDLNIKFLEVGDNWGDSKLDMLLENLRLIPKKNKIIGIFDRDKDEYIKKYELDKHEYKLLGKNVYAFAIPIVEDYGYKISIEHYYKRADLLKVNSDGRRLFLGEEFSRNSSKSLDNKYYTKISNIQNKVNINGIIDEKVYKDDDIEATNSIAMTKNAFADLILNDAEYAKDFDYSNFKKIFDVIRNIININ